MLTALVAAVGVVAVPATAAAIPPSAIPSSAIPPSAIPSSAIPPPGSPPDTVRVSHTAVTAPIAPGFVGFSFEFPAVASYAGSDPHAINPVLVQLIRDVAPGQSPVLRIGGNSTDNSWWPTAGVAITPGITFTLTRNWLATTRALAEKTGAQLILGLNLKLDNVTEVAAEARAYRKWIGNRHIEALEIGNEPELYQHFPWYLDAGGVPFYARPPTYDFSSYEAEVAAVASGLGDSTLAGPATGTPTWLSGVGRLFRVERHLKVVTYHRYPLLACFTTPEDPRYPSIPNLLAVDAARDLLRGTAPGIKAAHRHGATVRLDELNSVACQGTAGVSDTFASSLWMLDSLFAVARAGVDGVNIHTLPDADYQPFVFRRIGGHWLATVKPEYYALLMFARAAPPGSRMLAVSGTRDPDLRDRATITPDGLIHVVLINDSLTSGHVVLVHPPAHAGAGILERLSAPGANATNGVTLAGQTFGTETGTGLLKGTFRSAPVALVHGRYLLRMPASSAALLTFAPDATGHTTQ